MPTSVQDEEGSSSAVREFVVKLIFIWGIEIRLGIVLKECPRSIQIWTVVVRRAGIVVDKFVVIVGEEYR